MSPFTLTYHSFPSQHIREYPNAVLPTQETPLYLSVTTYIPLPSFIPPPSSSSHKKPITIIATHACGFPKELYAPLFADLLTALTRLSIPLRAIWAIDAAHQGKSGRINEFHLGNDPSWLDFSRDILHFTNVFASELPRPLVALGHSFGAAALANVAAWHPRLFSAAILIDPVISKYASSSVSSNTGMPASDSLYRRDLWPSRTAAKDSFLRNPYYQSWDPRVLDAWIEHGLCELPTFKYPDAAKHPAGTVTLATSKDQELFTYLRPSHHAMTPEGYIKDRQQLPDVDPSLPVCGVYPFYRPEGRLTLDNLPAIRAPALYIHGGLSYTSRPELRDVRVKMTGTGIGGSGGVASGIVKEEVIEDVGHLVPMERPGKCAEMAAKWIQKALEGFEKEEKRYEEYKKSGREGRLLSKGWEKFIKKPERPGRGSREEKETKI